jgi:hypothetical protein
MLGEDLQGGYSSHVEVLKEQQKYNIRKNRRRIYRTCVPASLVSHTSEYFDGILTLQDLNWNLGLQGYVQYSFYYTRNSYQSLRIF